METSRRGAREAVLLVNYIGRLLGAVYTFWLLPSVLGLEALGLYGGIHHMVFLLARMDLRQSVLRYGAGLEEGDGRRRKALLAWVWGVSTVWYGVVVGVCWGLRRYWVGGLVGRAPEMADYLVLVVGMGYVVLLCVTLKGWYMALGEVLWPSVLQHVVLPLLLMGWLGCYAWGWVSWKVFLYGMGWPYGLHLALLLGDLWRRGALGWCWDDGLWEGTFVRGFGMYSVCTLLASGMGMVMLRIDNVMVLGMCGKEVEGMYHTVGAMALLLEVPMKVVKQTVGARMVRWLERGAYGALEEVYKEATVWQFVVTSLCFVLLYVYAEYVLYAFPREAVVEMRRLFVCLGVAKVVDSVLRMGGEVLLLSRYYRWSVVGVALLGLGVVGNYVLMGWMGMYGAALATGLVLVVGGGIGCGLVWYKMGIHPLSWPLLGWAVVALGVWGGVVWMPRWWGGWVDRVVQTVFVLGVYGVCWGGWQSCARFYSYKR